MVMLNDHYRQKYGCKVYKLSLDGGFTCPNRDGTLGTRGCIFCSQSGSGEFAEKESFSIAAQLEKAKARVACKNKGGKYIAYFQSFTNTDGPVARLRELFTAAMIPEEIVGLAIGTRPDCLGEDVVALLAELNRVKPVEGVQQKDYDFLTFGWDFHRKGGDLIMDACRLLEADGYSFRLLFNGNVHTWPRLEEYMEGQKPQWLVLGDPVENINELFEDSRVFIQASRRETFSYAVCEAAYAGLPVISTDIAGLEWAHDLPTVDFVPGEDARALYVAMKRYLDGKTFSEEQHDHTRRVIADKYSTQEWTRKILNHYGV